LILDSTLADIKIQRPPEPVPEFTPYVSVRDRNIKADLCRVAKLFQYIDSGFAEYFQAVISRLPPDTVEGYLKLARDRRVKKKQASDQEPALDEEQALGRHKDRTDPILHLGDLGNFCEKVLHKLKTNEEGRVPYDITDCTRDELLQYLQDSFEIPYWEFMLKLFSQQHANSRSLSAMAVFRVLSSLKIEILHRRHLIRNDLSEDIEPLMKGIDARIKVLDQAWNKDTSELEASKLYQSLFETLELDRPTSPPEGEPAPPAKTSAAWPAGQQSSSKVDRKLTIPVVGHQLTFPSTRTPRSSLS
jgi:hypothetical protein